MTADRPSRTGAATADRKSNQVGTERVSPQGAGATTRHPPGDGAGLDPEGWLTVRRNADGHYIIWADAEELSRLRQLHRLPRTWANKARLAELIKPKPQPKS